MKRLAFTITTAIILTLLLFPAGKSHAITILYDATDLTDVTQDQDLWEYAYRVSDYSFDADYGFTIYFDYNLCGAIDPGLELVAPNSDWDVLTWDPNTSIPHDGAYDALALQNDASLADPFIVSFVWLGSGAPGSQYFEVYDSSYDTVESGETAPVPEPASVLLFGSGLAGLAVLRKRKNRSRT